jgi:diadenosine tetraphosphate (Ap4A) HIT family hydrolase
MNETIRKFGYPDTLVRTYDHWVVLVRPKQVTLGSLVLACTDPARALGEVGTEAFAELAQVTRDLEAALRAAFAYDRINYLLLMMVDPDVHFHVLPRYASERSFAGQHLTDSAWPKPPDVTRDLGMSADVLAQLRAYLAAHWPGP